MQEWLFEISPVTNTMSGWLAVDANMAPGLHVLESEAG